MRSDDVVRGGGLRKYIALHLGPVHFDDFRRRVVQDVLNQSDCSLGGPVRCVGVYKHVFREKVFLRILAIHSRRRRRLLLLVHFLVKPTKRRPRFAQFLFHHFRAKQVLEHRLILCNGVLGEHDVRWKGSFVIERKHLPASWVFASTAHVRSS